MSTDDIVSYERQKMVNRVFLVICIILFLSSLWLSANFELFWHNVFSFVAVPFGIFVIALGFGALSKRAIDYVPGEWKKQKKRVSFKEYEILSESHKEAYGHLIGDSESCGCCCACFILPVFGILIIGFLELAPPLFTPEFDDFLFFLLLFTASASMGFFWGFKYPKIDEEVFFKIPLDSDAYSFVKALDGVTGLEVGVEAEIGTRGDSRILLGAEPKILVDGLPDTVAVKVQVSHSGFAYPYLVGTIYKGPVVDEGTEHHNIRAKYPALIEKSMDANVSVFVARFDIPERTSNVPSISESDFRKLALLMVEILRDASR